MSSFAILLLCVQACLIQYTFGCPTASFPSCCAAAPRTPAGALNGVGCEAYNGVGVGNVHVSGGLDIKGTTRLTGTIPVLGCVTFHGQVPAYGEGSTAGSCGCGCA